MSIADFIKGLFFPKRQQLQSSTRKTVVEGWREIQLLAASRQPSSLKQAVITADKLLDAVLKDLAVGETLGERLKNSKDLFSGYDIYQKAWEAHKVRNSLVHETGYEPPYYVCNEAITNFNEVLRDLGAL